MEDSLLAKTGKSLEHWIEIVKKSGLKKHGEIIKDLKNHHEFTYGFANFVALKALKSDAGSINDNDLISNQYKGKESLKVIYDEFLNVVNKLGSDITITPKKDSVSFIRNKQFALLKPATKTRVDLGLKIKGVEPEGRLEDSGPFGTMCTHRVRIEKSEDLDSEVLKWLNDAYQSN
jgi:predicted transport protein